VVVVVVVPLFTIKRIFVGSFFAVNLFVGVIVNNFNRIRRNKGTTHDEGSTHDPMGPRRKFSCACRSYQVPGLGSDCKSRLDLDRVAVEEVSKDIHG